MAIVTQKSAFKPGTYKGRPLAADLLRQYAEGTNKALSLGVPVPGLEKHAPLNADDSATEKASATSGAGWLKKVLIEDDGSIGWEIDVPEKIESGIKDGTIRFTSPEFRPHYASADGKYTGPIIRHVAFTPLPKAHDQGALSLAMSEDAYQFGEDDFEGPAEKKKGDCDKGDSECCDVPPKDEATAPPKNPDSPPSATDKTKSDAVRECLSVLGSELTSDWSWDKPSAQDELLASLKTLAKAKAEAETEPDEPEEPDVKESPNMPFSEDDILALPEAMRPKARKANDAAKLAQAQAVQFAEERERTQRESLTSKAKAANITPAVKADLLNHLSAVQFSEEGETPSLTIDQTIALLEKATPPGLRFSEADVVESQHPDGEKFFTGDKPPTEEEAEALARRIHGRNKSAA